MAAPAKPKSAGESTALNTPTSTPGVRASASPGLPVLDREGQRCRVLARDGKNGALVEFEDGARDVISRNAL